MNNPIPPGSGRAVILIIEDDDQVARTLADLLGWKGYQAIISCNGQVALDWLRDHPLPDAILLDLSMPVMNGQEFRRRQVEDPRLAGIPVTIMTGGQPEDFDQRSLNAVAYLTKPFRSEHMFAILAGQVARSVQSAPPTRPVAPALALAPRSAAAPSFLRP